MKYIVYTDDHNNFYSRGIKRDFGINKIISLSNEVNTLFASVQPLSICLKPHKVIKMGTIECPRGGQLHS